MQCKSKKSLTIQTKPYRTWRTRLHFQQTFFCSIALGLIKIIHIVTNVLFNYFDVQIRIFLETNWEIEFVLRLRVNDVWEMFNLKILEDLAMLNNFASRIFSWIVVVKQEFIIIATKNEIIATLHYVEKYPTLKKFVLDYFPSDLNELFFVWQI